MMDLETFYCLNFGDKPSSDKVAGGEEFDTIMHRTEQAAFMMFLTPESCSVL